MKSFMLITQTPITAESNLQGGPGVSGDDLGFVGYGGLKAEEGLTKVARGSEGLEAEPCQGGGPRELEAVKEFCALSIQRKNFEGEATLVESTIFKVEHRRIDRAVLLRL